MSDGSDELELPVFSTLGIPGASCIVVSSIMIVVMPALAGYPVTTDDAKIPALFCVLSLVILAITWRAYRRVKSYLRGSAPFLMRAVPWFMLGGVVLGLVVGRGLGGFAVDAKADRVKELCDYVTKDHRDLQSTCRAQGPRCLGEGNELADRRWNVGFSSESGSPVSNRSEMFTAECLRTALKL
ncbi:MAG TPA: hypothetical protein VGM39_26370 [Kofleriaceae bacterium]|jgi:hypothetical protein